MNYMVWCIWSITLGFFHGIIFGTIMKLELMNAQYWMSFMLMFLLFWAVPLILYFIIQNKKE